MSIIEVQLPLGTAGLGSAIRTKRLRNRLTAKDVARAAGISAQFLCDIELGRRVPSPQVARGISEALGWPRNHIGRLVVEHYRYVYCSPPEDDE